MSEGYFAVYLPLKFTGRIPLKLLEIFAKIPYGPNFDHFFQNGDHFQQSNVYQNVASSL